jgi:hypothetical protein
MPYGVKSTYSSEEDLPLAISGGAQSARRLLLESPGIHLRSLQAA